MERSIRIGKDFNVRWSIRKVVDGERQPYELAGKELVLQYRTPYGLKEATEWKVIGNTIIWTFRGREQKALGSYELILTENGGKDGMVTVDTCRAFKLVAHSCEETEGSGSDIVIEDVVLESEVAFAPIVIEGGGGESYDDTEIKNQLAALQQKDAQTEAKLAELSEANEVLKEAQQFTDVAIKDLQDMKIDRENDDYYPKMAVGLADNLAGVDVVDSEINFRRSGGGAITDGVARIESIKGNSVVWNQLQIPLAEAENISTNRFSGSYSNGVLSLTTKVEYAASSLTIPVRSYVKSIPNHVYLAIAKIEGQTPSACIGSKYPSLSNGYVITKADIADYLYLFPFGATSTKIAAGTTCKVSEWGWYDLTQMFGSGNEPTTIEEFYQRMPMGVDMNAYNEGEVIHMDVQSLESQGVNAWDEEWENGVLNQDGSIGQSARVLTSIFPVIGGKAYFLRTPSTYTIAGRQAFYDNSFNLVRYDGDGAKPNAEFIAPSNASYMRYCFASAYGATYNHDICINLSDASINGKYYPYIKRQEDLSLIRKYFPEGMKSAGTAHDEIRYNKESGKWEKVEAIGTRAYQEGDAEDATLLTDGEVTCYPLAEPIVTELDEADQFKDLDYQVWNGGTEKAIAEGKSAPLAADITYGFNAVGLLKQIKAALQAAGIMV